MKCPRAGIASQPSPCDPQLGSISSLRCQKTRARVHSNNSTRSDVSRTIKAQYAVSAIKPSGGARRDRTDDLMLAKHALSQLSYGPVPEDESHPAPIEMVGLGRLELPTSRLSSARSNQLSYKPLTREADLHAHRFAPDATRKRSPNRLKVKARVRPRRKRNEDGEIPPMKLNGLATCWPLNVSTRSDKEA